jgi:hypothetical protein
VSEHTTSTPPFLYELGPEDARRVLDDVALRIR